MEITKGFGFSIKLLLAVAPFFLHVSLAQQCGSQADNARCPSGYCCSIYGYCGTTPPYCGSGNCQSQCPSSSPPPPDSGNGGPGVSTPSGCLKKNGIPVGWLPNEDNHGTMAQITSILGAEACFYGLYSQITSSHYDDSQLTARMPDIKASGAILQAAVMPTKVRFADINTDLASQIATSMKKFTDNGVEVWLRFAHEMNWYVRDGTYAGGTQQEFVTAWRNVANAVKGNSHVKMFWTPNNADVSTLSGWWPGSNYVDIVGIDIYPSPSEASSFSSVYGSFINAYSTKYNKPFAVGETGATDDATKRTWLTQLSSSSTHSQFPNYVGFSWFEYLKNGEDFRVVTGPVDIAKPILT